MRCCGCSQLGWCCARRIGAWIRDRYQHHHHPHPTCIAPIEYTARSRSCAPPPAKTWTLASQPWFRQKLAQHPCWLSRSLHASTQACTDETDRQSRSKPPSSTLRSRTKAEPPTLRERSTSLRWPLQRRISSKRCSRRRPFNWVRSTFKLPTRQMLVRAEPLTLALDLDLDLDPVQTGTLVVEPLLLRQRHRRAR